MTKKKRRRRMHTTSRHSIRHGLALLALAVGGVQAWSPASHASELSGIATLTSQYVYRGLAISGGDPALQLGFDYEHGSGLFAGIWASTIDMQTRIGRRDTELDYYVGYHYAPGGPVSLTLSLLRYTYPGQTGRHSYDHNEAIVVATFGERYSVELGYTSDLYGLDRVGRHWELRSEWPAVGAWVISAGVGGNDLDDLGASHYLHWDLGASARFSRLTLDLRWYDNDTPKGFIAPLSADSQFVMSLSTAF